MFRKADSSGDLAPAVERLHALADRLESVLSRVAAGGTASVVATTAMPTTSAAAPSNFPTSAPTSSPLADWASRVTPALAKLRAACSQTAQDAEIEALTDVLERAFGAEEAVLRQVAASASPPPDAAALERLLEPVAVVAGEADKLANPAGGRGRAVPKRLNQAKAVSELIPALLCVAYSGPSCGMSPPAQHVDESWQAAEFFANKAALEFRGGGSQAPGAEAQALWLRELRALAMALKEHVKVTAPQGPAWGVGVGSAAAAAAAAPPPPPPPPPPQPQQQQSQQRRAAPPPPPPPPPPGGPGSLLKKEAAAPAAPAPSSGGGGMAAVLAAIASKGDGATKGLRRVTDDMKSKNRSGAVPATTSTSSPAIAGASGAAAAAAPAAAAASSSSRRLPPPRLACEQGRKWVVENYRGTGAQANHDSSLPIVVDGANAKQPVYVFGCSDVVVKIMGKVNAVSVDNCSRAAVEVDGGVVASVEAVNSKNIILKNDAGLVSTWALDKCSGVSLILSRASLEGDAQVTTAQCSEVNIVLPEEEREGRGGNDCYGGDGDEGNGGPTELPVPEQFVTRLVAGKLVTEPVAHSGA